MNMDKFELKGKKVLLMGLGILGGGIATARFLVEKGASLIVTDMKTEEFLKPSLEKLKDLPNIKFVLGEHREEDFLNNEIIVINPDVPSDNKFVNLAREAGNKIENELTLFFKFAPSKIKIGITGTRGKTTTTNWIGHILKHSGRNTRVLGNDPEKPFLSEIYNCKEDTIAVIETPSFQLEIFGNSMLAPHVALITNLYQDHLSRHKTMEGYALAKANIFKNQQEGDILILNKDNGWTKFFLDQKPKAKVIFPSLGLLPNLDSERFVSEHGMHNLDNLLAAAAACFAVGVREEEIIKAVESLPEIKFREEKVFDNDKLRIYNDTTATSPDGTIAGIDRFKNEDNLILICGGTDRDLEFDRWVEVVDKNIKKENLILLSGSATEKMKSGLAWDSFNEFDTLLDCVSHGLEKAKEFYGKTVILFSPSAKSFEKFKNEFDRGEKFNAIIKKIKI